MRIFLCFSKLQLTASWHETPTLGQNLFPQPIKFTRSPIATALTAVSHQRLHAESLLIDCLLLTASHLSRISWASKWGDKPMSPWATLGACAAPPAAVGLSTIIHLVILVNLTQIKQHTALTLSGTTIRAQEAFGKINRICNFPFIYLWDQQEPPAIPSMVYLPCSSIRNSHKLLEEFFLPFTISVSAGQGKQKHFEQVQNTTRGSQWVRKHTNRR